MKNASILLVLLLALVSTTSTVNGLRVKAMKGSGDKDKDKDKEKDKSTRSADKAPRSSRDESSSSTVSSIFCLMKMGVTYFVVYFVDILCKVAWKWDHWSTRLHSLLSHILMIYLTHIPLLTIN